MERKKILVLYYTQTGQLEDILKSISSPLATDHDVYMAPYAPVEPFPYPWNGTNFFNAMPECVLQLGVPIKSIELENAVNIDFDLIILGYQPWFLHPSQPTIGFFNSKYAALLESKPVITVLGCRNMWLQAQEVVKKNLLKLNAQLVGNIVLLDKHPNLISLLTVIRWTFKGQKEASSLLPEAGVTKRDINDAQRFGIIINNHLNNNDLKNLHQNLINNGSYDLNKTLILLESNAVPKFRFWAKKAYNAGPKNSSQRINVIKIYRALLLTGIFVLSPISGILAKIKTTLQSKSFEEKQNYFKSLDYKEGMF